MKNILLILFFSGMVLGADYYVATDGTDDDVGDRGAIGNPWETITYAVREGSSVSPGDTIHVRGGSYFEAVRFYESGTAGNPITLKAYAGETPVLDGTETITGWTQCVSDEAFLTVQGVTNPNYASIYKATIATSLLPDVEQYILFEDAIYSRIAREPDQEVGYGLDALLFYPLAPEAYGETEFILDTARLTQADDYWLGNETDTVWVDVWSHAANNAIVQRAIASSSLSAQTITFSEPLPNPISTGSLPDAYSILNHPVVLDSAGEFAHTTADVGGYHTFYYWPNDVANLTSNITVVSKLTALYGVSQTHFTIDGFEIVGYSSNGIEVLRGTNPPDPDTITVRNCTIHDLGNHAITLLVTDNATIEDCEVDRVGGYGAFISTGDNGLVQRCDLNDSERTNLVFFTMTNSQVLNNIFRGSSGVHGSGTAIYWNCDTVLVAYNDYLNASMSFQDITNLIVYSNAISGGPINIWGDTYGHTSEVLMYINNVVVDADDNAAILLAQGASPDPLYYAINNIIDGLGTQTDYGSGYVEIEQVIERDNNLYTGYTWTQAAQYNWTLGTNEIDGRAIALTEIFTDPDLIDDATADFTLAVDSPAIGQGTEAQTLFASTGVATWFPDFDFTLDKAGNAWNGTPSMGAYEFAQAEAAIPKFMIGK